MPEEGFDFTAAGHVLDGIRGAATKRAEGSTLKAVCRAPAIKPSAGDDVPQIGREPGRMLFDTGACTLHGHTNENTFTEQVAPAGGLTATKEVCKWRRPRGTAKKVM